MLFHRLALSKDKESIIALATEGQEVQRAEDVVNAPYVLEFLNLPQ
jgi:predicted nuclease of restriction endonuclease-like (RecB) superfamily